MVKLHRFIPLAFNSLYLGRLIKHLPCLTKNVCHCFRIIFLRTGQHDLSTKTPTGSGNRMRLFSFHSGLWALKIPAYAFRARFLVLKFNLDHHALFSTAVNLIFFLLQPFLSFFNFTLGGLVSSSLLTV